jgi:hypothetical protein
VRGSDAETRVIGRGPGVRYREEQVGNGGRVLRLVRLGARGRNPLGLARLDSRREKFSLMPDFDPVDPEIDQAPAAVGLEVDQPFVEPIFAARPAQ